MVSPLFARAAATSSGLSNAFHPTTAYAPVSPSSPTLSPQATTVAASAAEKSAKWDSRYAGPIPHDTGYYLKCMVGGALACGLTHTAITPLDVAKCNAQVNPAKYGGAVNGIKTIMAEEGATALFKGWLPTLIGYSGQGLFKVRAREPAHSDG
jgi:Mitochondrial carrier protein